LPGNALLKSLREARDIGMAQGAHMCRDIDILDRRRQHRRRDHIARRIAPPGEVCRLRGQEVAKGFDHVVDRTPVALDPNVYPSGGAGMVGTACDMLRCLEAMRTGGSGILRPETVKLEDA
jgi:hypothetical protein